MTMEGDPFSLIEGMTTAGLVMQPQDIFILDLNTHTLLNKGKAIVLANNESI